MQIHSTPSSPEDRAFIARMLADADFQRRYAGDGTLAGMRAGTAAVSAHGLVRQPDPTVTVVPRRIAGLDCEVMQPAGAATAASAPRTLLYIHGGAFVRGNLALGRANATWLASAAGARVVAVGYRQAPEHPFPAAPDDVLAVYRALVADVGGAQHLVAVGESSGGTLALVLAAQLQAAGAPLPAGIAALSPLADLALRGASWWYNARKDIADRATGERALQMYLQGAGLDDPRACPMHHHWRGACPLLLAAGSHETMLSDIERLAWRADAAGVDVTLRVYGDMLHGFTRFATDIAVTALDDAGRWCAAVLDRAAAGQR